MHIDNLYDKLSGQGIILKTDGEHLYFHPKEAMNGELISTLRRNRDSIIEHLLTQQGRTKLPLYLNPPQCRNPFTPHSSHEFPWECDPGSCLCYKNYGYPHLCRGVPCRWIWPTGITDQSVSWIEGDSPHGE